MEIKTFRNFVDLLHFLDMILWENKEEKMLVEITPMNNRWRLSYEKQTPVSEDSGDEVVSSS